MKHNKHYESPKESEMIRRRNNWTSVRQILTLCFSLIVFMLMSGNVHAALSCNGCHGMPPLDSAGTRDASTGAFKGNHAGHAGSTIISCTACHGDSVTAYTSAHSTMKVSDRKTPVIIIAPKIHNYSTANGRANYSRGTFFNQTSVPPVPLGSCSNVNCHFEATTPAWGSANYTAPTDCDKCHGAAPNNGNHPFGVQKHATYYGTGTASCAKCHPDHMAEAKPFAHATSAGGRNLIVSFAAAPNNGKGAYSGALNDYLPSQTNVFGSCTATYCHSNGKKGMGNFSTNTVPAWGGSGLTCKGCHKSDDASGDAMSSGSHGRHIGTVLYRFDCVRCHAATVNSGLTVKGFDKHVNGGVDLAFDSSSTAVGGTYKGSATPLAVTPGTLPYGSCNNVYCHSNGQNEGGVGITYKQPTWGDAPSGACGSCHNVSAGFGHGTGSQIASGSHSRHLTFSYGMVSAGDRCTICHDVGNNFSNSGCSQSCHGGAVKHVNNQVDVRIPSNFGASASYSGTPRPGDGYGSCSNVSCHYNTTTPAWGTASAINCFGCHTLAALLASGAHAKHISASAMPVMYNYTANRSTAGEYDFGCSSCHPVSIANHMNNTVNVTLNKNEAGVGSLRTKNSATAAGIGVANSGITGASKVSVVCTASYCHSNGNASALIYAATPNWYGGAFTGDRCANCHGNAPNSTIAGSKAHYNTKFLGYTSNAGGHQIGIHAMKIYSSPGGLAKAGTAGSSSHGNAGTSTTISCNICHYATVTTARNDSNPACAACHYSGNTVGAQFGNLAVIANKSRHVNGAVDITFQPVNILSKAQMRPGSFKQSLYSSVWNRNAGYKSSGAFDSAKGALNTGAMWDNTTKTCSNIACHNGQSVKWNDNDGITDCVSCHAAM